MNRRTDKQKVLDVVQSLKQAIPNIAIRSTFILGFPGETNNEFNEVLEFLNSQKLTNVGFFAYSREEGTRAYNFPNQVHKNTKNARVKKAYLTQQIIAENNNLSLVNKVLDVIIDEEDNDTFIGRSYLSAPDVDPVVLIPKTIENKTKISVGNIIKVKITQVVGYDLEGELYEFT
jgi:ribosomal protein S12 methylthiotransferase